MVTHYKAKFLRRHYIKEWLAAKDNTSQTELARRMGTDKANVSRWIKDPQRINLDILSGVADALEMADAGDLLRPPHLVRAIHDAHTAAQHLADTTRPAQSELPPAAHRTSRERPRNRP